MSVSEENRKTEDTITVNTNNDKMELPKVNFLDISSIPPIVKIMNYGTLRKIDRMRDGKKLTKEEWVKVIKAGRGFVLDFEAGSAASIRDKKIGDVIPEGEYTLVLSGNTYEQLAEELMKIHEEKYGHVTVSARFLLKKDVDVFERKKKVDLFLHVISLVRTADHECFLYVLVPDAEDEDIVKRVMDSGADKIGQIEAEADPDQ